MHRMKMPSTCKGGSVATPRRGGEGQGSEGLQGLGIQDRLQGLGIQDRLPRLGVQERLQGLGVQDWLDGSRYEGTFVNGLKHGEGRYTWRNGEFYEGYFHKDYKHGDGLYCWPTGHTFIGKFYLNRKEGYGKQVFPDKATFQGLYHADQRFGPGVVSDPDGCEDVGLWLGERLLKLCTTVEEGFSMKSFPEYASHMDPANNTDSLTQPSTDYPLTQARTHYKLYIESDVPPDEVFILPPEIETYSTDGDHLPLPPGRRRELDQCFYGELWEPDAYLHQGYERDPLSTLPLHSRMQTHIHKHRQQANNVDWDVAAVLSLNRDSFGPKGPLEVSSELLIQHASRGELQAVMQILQTGAVHPDVADSHGHTALIAATVNCHNNVIHLLLDMGADIDKLNSEGMSALAVCFVIYYPFQSLHTPFVEPPAKTQALRSSSACGSSPQISQVDLATDTFSTKVFNDYKLITELKEPETFAEAKHLQEEGSKGNEDEEEEGGEFIQTEKAERERENKEEDKEKESDMESTQEYGESELKDPELDEKREAERDDVEVKKEDEKKENESVPVSERWMDCEDTAEGVQGKDKELTHTTTFDSTCLDSSYNIQNTEGVMQQSTETLSCKGLPQLSGTQDTVQKAAAVNMKSSVRLNTLKLLLERGADPNVCRVPMPVLFLAIMAADPEAVRRLLLCGARTDIPLPIERKGLYPLHLAAALPGSAGPKITELLLHAVTDPDAQACDQDEIYELDKINKPLSMNENNLKAGGRTALHVACQRDSDHRNVSKIVALLLSHGASTDLLWSGHSPLSLAIASGNDMAVEELLKGGANPNLPLGGRVGSALCALANFKYHLGGNRAKLLDMLAKAGADILIPVKVGELVGNAVDYAHHSFNQDLRIAHTPFHALNMREREIFKTRRHLLNMMGDLLRQTACKRHGSSNGSLPSSESLSPITGNHRTPEFKFCYHCGRSVSVKLTACSRCHKVFYCSRNCKLKAWDERHKQECVRESDGNQSGSVTAQQTKITPAPKPYPRSTKGQTRKITAADDIQRSAAFKTKGGPRPLTAMVKPKTVSRPLIVELKSQRLPEPLSMAEVQNNLKENYSHN
ncbi:ankyrin repeat and MYND domain-containing protein 1 isoform X2 [Notolabrus celidotus]|uniref:ankyrin repeat and MYND domain-containing protein 1 isoform X2 n=1 Tax=Notolabrus celidotus TaxID=1203425 RepID=UPI0014900CCC|nr:ankyrin repeat and MYND domain-containing protein 1 isoform X2 [Notolabrus celidotus]